MRGQRAAACANHLHQLHVCLPAGPGRTRLLYRMSMDFLGWTRWLPGIQAFWAHIAQQVGGLPSALSVLAHPAQALCQLHGEVDCTLMREDVIARV